MEEPLCDEDDILVAPGGAAVDSSTYLKEETFISNDIVERYDDDAPQVEHYSEVGSESGVEPDYTEWIFDDAASEAGVLFDLSNEQAMATLKYFTSTADRTNMMTKFHSNDLDLISQVLNDKEKDLELAAKIGQSLLQRNKSLMVKIEKMEDYLNQTMDNEQQLKFDLQQKNELVKMYWEDGEERSISSVGSQGDACDDEDMMRLTKRCRDLEKENHDLFSEALDIRQLTNDIEDKEEGLVFDCIQQLSEAKTQITTLTDEIAEKFEDNLQQQEEITQLINMVVELQKKQKQLSAENDLLQNQLQESNENQDNLKEQLIEMQKKFRETYEMLQENQEEMKNLKSRLDSSGNPSEWLNDSSNSLSLQDSLANEIEEFVRRDLTIHQDKKRQNKKVLDNVRMLNNRETFSISTSGRTSPASNWSFASDERSEAASTFSFDEGSRPRKPAKKLQIVKPMEGSDTLSKWHHLASQNVRGGLHISERDNSPLKSEKGLNVSLDDDRSTVIGEGKFLPKAHSIIDSSTDDEKLETVRRPPPRTFKQSTPNGGNKTSDLLNLLGTPAEKKRTIITRSSSALNSLRQGRKLLKSQGSDAKSKSEVIGMIANAMSKVNVEAQTEQRILSSLSQHDGRGRALSLSKSPEYKDYVDMPNVSRVLEKAASSKQIEEEDVTPVVSDSEPTEYRKSILPEKELDSITGPLGLLNRADPIDTNDNIMNRLYRLSGHSTNAPQPRSEENKTIKITTSATEKSETTMKRNKSSGSLVDMMMNNKIQARPFGLSNLVSTSSADNFVNDTNSVSNLKDNATSRSVEGGSDSIVLDEDLLKRTSKSMEAGLDTAKRTESSASSSGYSSGFFSFLGKFT